MNDRRLTRRGTGRREVQGYCPMGCGETLGYVDDVVACLNRQCPRPSAVHEILADRETEHVVVLHESTFTVRHPLRERLDDQLVTCRLHLWLQDQDGPPAPLGRYRVTASPTVDGHWHFVQINQED